MRNLEPKTKEKLEEFLHSKEITKGLRRVATAGQKSLVIAFEQLLEFDMELAKALLDNPTDFLDTADEILEGITKLPGMRLRVKGLDKSVEIRNIRAKEVGKFIQVEGILTRSGEVKPEAKVAVFKCRRCDVENSVPQVGEFFREPLACSNPNCLKRGPFDLLIESTVFRDWQSLCVQEPPEKLRGGRMPRRLDGIVRDDFVDKAVPGNHVVLTGELRVFQEGRHQERKRTFRKILFVNHIEVLQKGVEEAELTPESEERIKELARDPWVRDRIIQSIAPNIYGYEAIKEAIALQLFGCNPVELPDGTRIRGDTHILLTGDPAVAKSQLLKWVANVAPRGLYTSGMKATGAGLCIAPDSLIWVRNDLISISDLVENHYGGKPVSEIASMSVEPIPQFNGKNNTITSLWKIPSPQKMVEIRTQYGKRIEVTPETKIMTDAGWKKAEELTASERVVFPINYGEWNTSYSGITHFYPANVRIKNGAEIFKKISSQIKEKRALARILRIPEDKMYYRWAYDDVRGAMTLGELRKVCTHLNLDVDEVLDGCELKCQLRSGVYFKLPIKLSPGLAYFVGFIAGDSSLSQKKIEKNSTAIRFSNNDLKRKYIELVRKLFGKEVEVTPALEKRAQDFRFGNRAIFKLLKGLGIQKPEKLFIPREIVCNKELVTAYLRGLFDTNGSVYDRRSHGGGKRGEIELITIYREFAEQIQNTLFRLGIPAYIREREPRITGQNGKSIKSRKQYRISITQNAAISRFAELVGFSVQRKKEKLGKIVGRKGECYKNHVLAKIKKVQIVRPRYPYVYDITVEGSHSFIANGILVHNTAAAIRDEIGGGWALEAGALVIADGGLTSIDEFEKMSPEDASAILESLEQQSFHPSLEVLLANGKKVKIGELVDSLFHQNREKIVEGINCQILPLRNGPTLFTQSPRGIERFKIERISRHKSPSNFVRIVFSNGREIIVTPEHPVFISGPNGEIITVPAERVNVGDFAPAARKIPNSAEPVMLRQICAGYWTEKEISLPSELKAELAQVLGFLITDGYFHAPVHEIGFTNSNPELLTRVEELMWKVFGISPRTTRGELGVFIQRYVSTRLYRWFEENFPEMMKKAPFKRVPSKIIGASAAIAREFLEAAFLGDGGVEGTSLSYGTRSKGLAEDYQDLLLKLGIGSRLLYDVSNDSYKVYISGDSLKEFYNQIIRGDPRIEKIRKIINRSASKLRHHDVSSVQLAARLRGLLKRVGLKYTGYFHEHLQGNYGITREVTEKYVMELRNRVTSLLRLLSQTTTLRQLRDFAGISQVRLAKLMGLKRGAIDYTERGGYDENRRKEIFLGAQKALLDEIHRIRDELEKIEELVSRYRWLRVRKVEILPNDGKLKTEWVYDVTVEPTHNFISHGLLLHNTVSIAKAGIVATLNTRTAVLAAANPKLGRFEPSMTIPQQIVLDPVILSRFDLIFIMRDVPRPERDRDIARHILGLHSASKKVVKAPFDVDFLRQIIIYARKNLDPKFEDEEPMKVIEDFFVEWRKVVEKGAPLPITVRQLEALVRLAKANARLRLSDRVTVEDANRAIKLVEFSLQEAGIDTGTGKVDIDIWMTGKPKSQREKIQRVLEIIEKLESDYGGAAPIEEIKRLAESETPPISSKFVEQMIDQEKMRGHLYEPKPGMVSRAVK